MKFDLLGIGNALVDIEVRVDDEFIEQNSLTKGGMTLFSVKKQQKILKKLHSLSTKISSGGSAANTIHGLSVLGGKTYYIGRVANDVYGKHYAEDTFGQPFCETLPERGTGIGDHCDGA